MWRGAVMGYPKLLVVNADARQKEAGVGLSAHVYDGTTRLRDLGDTSLKDPINLAIQYTDLEKRPQKPAALDKTNLSPPIQRNQLPGGPRCSVTPTAR